MKSKSRYKEIKINSQLVKRARLLSLAGDPTRIRILCFMFRYKKACVSDIARSLDMSIASISHHLQVMRDNGLFTSERSGNNVCYSLVKNKLTDNLEKMVCEAEQSE